MASKRPSTAEQARARGYCITSRKFRMATRLDSPDWKERLASSHPSGMRWVNILGPKQAADQYRRCHGTDTIIVPASWIPKLGNSYDGPSEFLP